MAQATALRSPRSLAAAVVLAVVVAVVLAGVTMRGTHRAAAASLAVSARTGWQAAWRAAPQPPRATGLSHAGFAHQTVRMVVRTAVGGRAVRIRLSNGYGSRPLRIGHVAIAAQLHGAAAGGQHLVTFAGHAAITVKTGTEIVSDPVAMSTARGDHLVVSVYLPVRTGPTTWHSRAQLTSYLATGDRAASPDDASFHSLAASWFFLDGLDTLGPPPRGVVVAFGDSITDGSTSTVDAYRTYPDQLADRLGRYAVLNEGISGNQILTGTQGGGDSALRRFGHDALDQPGASAVVFLEGINDITSGRAGARQLILGMRELIDEAHARCVAIIGATITPFGGSGHFTTAGEQVRESVNRWIRTSGAFDAVADFDAALRDRADPIEMDPRYHQAGNLHPNDTGYGVMADTVAPTLLRVHPGCTI